MAVCASKAEYRDPPNLRQTTSLRQVPRSSASSKRFPRFSAGHVSKRKRQPGEGIVMRTSSPHVHVRNATQAPNPLAFESFVCNIINQLRPAKLKIIASPRFSVFKGSAAPILRFPGSARPSAPDSKNLGQPTPAPTSSTCQQKIVISQSSSIGNTTSKILRQQQRAHPRLGGEDGPWAPTPSSRPERFSAPASFFLGQQTIAPSFSICRQPELSRRTISQRQPPRSAAGQKREWPANKHQLSA